MKNLYQIIFEDTHLIVIDKAAGLLSQGDISGESNLVDLMRAHFGRNYVGLVHRLDRNTSGLMVIAKRSKSAERLTEALQSGSLDRAYLCCVYGKIPQEFTWEDYLLKDESTNTVRCVPEGTKGAKKSKMSIAPVRSFANRTLCRVDLETGRSHQIRVQCAYHHYPLLGDNKYASGPIASLAPRPALHSAYLKFPHPMSHEVISFESQWPADLEFLLK